MRRGSGGSTSVACRDLATTGASTIIPRLGQAYLVEIHSTPTNYRRCMGHSIGGRASHRSLCTWPVGRPRDYHCDESIAAINICSEPHGTCAADYICSPPLGDRVG